MKTVDLKLETMSGGEAVRLFNEALSLVLEDIVDPNTPPDAKRSITLKVTLAPDYERTKFAYGVSVKTSLPGLKPTGSIGYIGHGRDGVTASEVDPEQRTIAEAIADAMEDELPSGGTVTVIPAATRQGGSR